MGKLKGFMEFQRNDALKRPIKERLSDYNEVTVRLPEDEIVRQAARCMDCGIPFCHAMGCPIYNFIPEWNEYIFRQRWDEAFRRLELTNNFPEITGRICPAPCEPACTLAINESAVTVRQNELAVIEKAFSCGLVKPRPPKNKSGKRVAIVGSGPAGLAAAQQLTRLGHDVMVLEKGLKIGGILRNGIPNFKLEKWVIDRRLDQMQAEGTRFETDVKAGEDISAHYLRKSFDAILLACGAEVPRDLPVPGRDLNGIYFAMQYLSNSNNYVAADTPVDNIITARGKNVLVIGGGDTGADCVGTANRQGAKNVYQFEILPQPPDWKQPWNPDWPNWPNILRTSTSHEEGCKRQWSVLTKSFEGQDSNRISKVNCVKVVWKEKNGTPDMAEVPGSGFSLDVDLVILALGFTGVEPGRLIKDLNVSLTDRNSIVIDESYMTSGPGVFAAGDSAIGPSLVVRAIFQGREAAKCIHKFIVK